MAMISDDIAALLLVIAELGQNVNMYKTVIAERDATIAQLEQQLAHREQTADDPA